MGSCLLVEARDESRDPPATGILRAAHGRDARATSQLNWLNANRPLQRETKSQGPTLKGGVMKAHKPILILTTTGYELRKESARGKPAIYPSSIKRGVRNERVKDFSAVVSTGAV